jgi:undecaprenyl-diphosphatase
LICVAAGRRLQQEPRRRVWTAAISWAALVGVTRVYLGVHWPTDVLGGWLLAAALVAAGCLVREAVSRRPEPAPPGPAGTSLLD